MRASRLLVVLTLAGALLGGAAAGQPADSSGRNAAPPGDPATFVRFAASSATLQVTASEQAVRESSRPDVKDFAQHAIQVQRDLCPASRPSPGKAGSRCRPHWCSNTRRRSTD